MKKEEWRSGLSASTCIFANNIKDNKKKKIFSSIKFLISMLAYVYDE